MNQHNVVGIGNIYVNEALFLSKIKPSRICNNLNKNEIKKNLKSFLGNKILILKFQLIFLSCFAKIIDKIAIKNNVGSKE